MKLKTKHAALISIVMVIVLTVPMLFHPALEALWRGRKGLSIMSGSEAMQLPYRWQVKRSGPLTSLKKVPLTIFGLEELLEIQGRAPREQSSNALKYWKISHGFERASGTTDPRTGPFTALGFNCGPIASGMRMVAFGCVAQDATFTIDYTGAEADVPEAAAITERFIRANANQ